MEALLWIGFLIIIAHGAEKIYQKGREDAEADLEDNSWIE